MNTDGEFIDPVLVSILSTEDGGARFIEMGFVALNVALYPYPCVELY